MGARIEEIDRRIASLTEERNTIASDQSKALANIEDEKESLAKMEKLDVDEIRQKIRTAGEVNGKVAANRAHAELSETVASLESQSESLTEGIDEIDAEKSKELQAAPFPVPGLGLDDNGVTFNGLPFEQASGAERLRASAAIGMAQKPKLRVMLIRDASLLDDDGLAIIEQMATAEDYQVWLERVAKNAEGCAVYIEDGAVKEMEAATA
jgi:chaperonin cofactor prefoldin